MADKNLSLKIQVNAETGELEVLGTKLQEAGQHAGGLEKAFGSLAGGGGQLLKSLLGIAGAAGFLEFMKESVKQASQEEEALRKLAFAVDSSGSSWNDNKDRIKEWAEQLQRTTAFSNTEAYDALTRMTRATGDLSQGQTAVKVAMGLSAQTGKSLSETMGDLESLINGNERAVRQMHREYGTFVEGAHTSQQMLDLLGSKFFALSGAQTGFAKDSAQLSHEWEDFMKMVGSLVIPGLSQTLGWIKDLIAGFIRWKEAVADFATFYIATMQHVAAIVIDVMTGSFTKIPQEMREMRSHLASIGHDITQDFEKAEEQKTRSVEKHAETRVRLVHHRSEQEIQLEKQQALKIEEIQAQLAQQLDKLGVQTLQKKQARLTAEVALERKKIETEVADNKKKNELLLELDTYYHDASAELVKDDLKVKQAAAMDAAQTSLEALSIVNDMDKAHNQAQVNRAKAILLLEKSIAIMKAIAAAQEAGPFAPVVAAANIALIVAQTAQQWRAIDDAASMSQSSTQSFSTDIGSLGGPTPTTVTQSVGAPLPGTGGILSTRLGAVVNPTASPSLVPSSASSSFGGGVVGGGGTITINVGGVIVNFTTDHIDLNEIDVILRRVAQACRAGTVDAVQMALASQNLAERNAGLAS